MTQQFFKTVQNKMHYSVHGHTAAEIIYERADAQKDFMGLTTWSGAMPTKPEAEVAKNYLTKEEMTSLMTSSVSLERISLPMLARFPLSWQRRKQTKNTTSSKNVP